MKRFHFQFSKSDAILVLIVGCLYGFTLFMGKSLLEGERFYNYFTYWKSFVYLGLKSLKYSIIPVLVLTAVIQTIKRLEASTRISSNNSKTEYCIMTLGMIALYFPCYIAYDHGISSYDAQIVILEASGKQAKSNYQPYFHTLIWKLFYTIEKITGINNIAISLYTITQIIFISSVSVYIIYCLSAYFQAGKAAKWIAWAFYALNPTLTLFSMILTKDIFFAGMFAMYSIAFLNLSHPDRVNSTKETLCLAVYSLLASLLRNNFIYVAIVMVIVTAVYYFRHRRADWRIIILAEVAAIASYFIIVGPVYTLCGVASSPKRESLSVPIQQISAVYSSYPGSLTKEEKDRVLKYIPDAGNYQPMNADPVKNTFKELEYDNNKSEFWKTYLYFLKKCPGEYFDAFLYLHIPFVYPDLNVVTYIETRNDGDDGVDGYSIEQRNELSKVRKYYEIFAGISDDNAQSHPIIHMLFSIHWPFWILLVCLISLMRIPVRRYLVCLLPSVLLWGTYLVGPLCNYRYIYPMVVLYPLYFTLIVISVRNPLRQETARDDRLSLQSGNAEAK